MNSPIGNKPNEKQPTQRELIEQAISATVMEIIQLRRTLWLVVKQAGAPVIVDETECHPLWQLKATRVEQGKAQLEAIQLPEPTHDALTAIAETLNGSMTELETAMEETELKAHPPAYIQMRLQSMIVRREDGYWVDAALAKISDGKPTGDN